MLLHTVPFAEQLFSQLLLKECKVQNRPVVRDVILIYSRLLQGWGFIDVLLFC